jgi:hypothetical protein
MLGKNLIQAAAGNAGGAGGVLGVEDVFSTWLYTGNSSTQGQYRMQMLSLTRQGE